MSHVVEIVVPEVPTALNGLEEQFASFCGERIATDPRTFLFDGRIKLTLRPTAPHILTAVTEKLRTSAESLVLDEALVLEWSARRLAASDATVLRKLFENMPGPFAVAVETGVGEGVGMSNSAPSLAFNVIDPIVRGETSHDLTIIVVYSEEKREEHQ
jgi:hypothetical protein